MDVVPDSTLDLGRSEGSGRVAGRGKEGPQPLGVDGPSGVGLPRGRPRRRRGLGLV